MTSISGLAFSIILATRNSATRIHPLIRSLLLQSELFLYELLVVDASSVDSTLSLVAQSFSSASYRVCSCSDYGIYDAWNRALSHIRAPWVLFLGDDDRLASPAVLSELVNLISKASLAENCDVLLCSCIGAGGQLIRPRFDSHALWRGMRFAHPASLIRTSVLQQHGFDASYRIAGDYAFFLAHPELRVALIPEITLTRIGAGGISQTKLGLLAREVYRALRSNGYSRIKSSYYPARILLKALLRWFWR